MKSSPDYTGQTVEDLLHDPMMEQLFRSDRTNGEQAKNYWLNAMRSRNACEGVAAAR